MAGPKVPSIPSWQQAANSSTAPDAESPQKQQTPQLDDDTLLKKASQFLQDESIRDAPTDQKIAFLESKGVKKADVQKLLGNSENSGASEKAEAAPEKEAEMSTDSPISPAASVSADSSSTENVSSTPSSSSQSPSTSNRDIPPIITYPEFLTQTTKPPPLINLQTVLYTLYGAAGAASIMYGASEYLIKPMIASLTEARHELATATQHNLDAFNEKLEEVVSTIPPTAVKSKRAVSEEQRGDDDALSITSDPTELYHRDIATQTSPESESYPLKASTKTSESPKALDTHVSRLKSISSQLNDIIYVETHTDDSHSKTQQRISDLQVYLDSLAYTSPSYINSSLYGIYGDDTKNNKAGMSDGEADAIAAFRSEVRSAKGVLLSARNFPAGRGGGRLATRAPPS